jgi:hypothetical protein
MIAALSRKPKAAEPSDPAGVLAELDKRLAELALRERRLLAEQIELEGRGVKPRSIPATRKGAVTAEASALLAGDDAAVDRTEPEEVRLHHVIQQRQTIAGALEIGRQRGLRLRLANAAEMTRDIEAAWRANVVATVKHLADLRELAAERERLSAEYSGRLGGLPINLPLAGQGRALARGDLPDGVAYVFARDAERAGFRS